LYRRETGGGPELRLVFRIRGNAEEGRLAVVDKMELILKAVESRLSARIGSTLIKAQHNVASGNRVEDELVQSLLPLGRWPMTSPAKTLRRRKPLTMRTCDSVAVRHQSVLDEPILLAANPLRRSHRMEFVFEAIIEL